MKPSIIVPLLNEAAALPSLLLHLRELSQFAHEIILVDGGSEDESASLIAAAGFHLYSSSRGRARQMNTGARSATGEALLFLHADTRLPDNAIQLVMQALEREKYAWGRFDVTISGQSPMLRIVSCLMNWRSLLSGIATGDMAIFVTRKAFDSVRGFPEQPLMEDVALSQSLLRISRPVRIRQRVITSGRRWESNGVWRTIFLMWRLRWAYWRGVPAEELANAYRSQ